MRRKFVVLLLATAVACAGMVPLASPAPAANIVPSKAFLEVIANKQPGVLLPEINKGITKAVTGQVTDVATSGMSKFLFDKLSGPLAQAGFGFAMNALGLNKLLHFGSPDQAALEQVQEQLKVISAQIQQLQGDLQTTFGAIKQTDLNRDVTTLDGYATTVQKTYRDYFKPMLDDGDALAKAEKELPRDEDKVTKARTALIASRDRFYFEWQLKSIGDIAPNTHLLLVPRASRTSVMSELGSVILSDKRYLNTEDSARIRQIYFEASATEAMAAWMTMERWLPSDPAPINNIAPGNANSYNSERQEFLDNTVAEFINLPPMIPLDAVVDAAAPGIRTNTRNVPMYMPASDAGDLSYFPGFAGPGSVDDTKAAMNSEFRAGFDNWTVPSRNSVSTFLNTYSGAKDPTINAFLSSLNPPSPAWKAISDQSWPFIWSSDLGKTDLYCGNELSAITTHLGVTTTTKSQTWTARPFDVTIAGSGFTCLQYIEGKIQLTGPGTRGGLLAMRSTGDMSIDYMAQGAGPNIKPGANLRRTDLSGYNLTGVDLSGADLRGSNLKGATLVGTKLATANLAGVSAVDITGAPASLPPGWRFITRPAVSADAEPTGALVGPGANLTGADMSGLDLSGANLTGVKSGGTNCEGCALPAGWHWTGASSGYLVGPGADLSYTELIDLDFRGFDLSGVDFTHADLTNVNLDATRLSGVKVTDAAFTPVSVAGVTSGGIVGTPIALAGTPRLVSGYVIAPGLNLTGANLAGADLSNADLTGANLTSANLTNANLTSAVLKNVNITRATITGATFSTNDDNKLAGIKSGRLVGQPKALPASGRFRVVEGYFIGPSANLEGTQFTSLAQLGVSLSGTNFTGAFLAGVNFTGATLTNTIFTGANLQAANLSGASMTNAQLFAVRSGSIFGTPSLPPDWKLIKGYLVGPGANLRGAALGGANFTGANLSGADLSLADVTNAIWSNTTCPNGTVQSTPCPLGYGLNGRTSVTAVANELGTGMRVNVQPDLGTAEWAVTIEKVSESGGWIRVGPVYRTRGGNDQLTINLDEGTYRAVVPAQRNYAESMSAVVVLKK